MLNTTVKRYGKKLLQEGIKEGILKGKLETAGALLKEKMPVKKISEITGLSVEQIENLVR